MTTPTSTATTEVCESETGKQAKVSQLTPYADNAKIHTVAGIEKLAASIKKFGWTTRIVVDGKGVVIAGHGRLEAAKLLGLDTVPVIVRDDLTEAQVKMLRLADNKVTETGYDQDLMSKELLALLEMPDQDDASLSMFFDDKDLDFASGAIEDMDFDAITDDLSKEVEEHSERTQRSMDLEEHGEDFSLAKALGFDKVPAKYQRTVTKFAALIEAETGEVGAQAFVAYLRDYMGL